jgi:hypothetical protein
MYRQWLAHLYSPTELRSTEGIPMIIRRVVTGTVAAAVIGGSGVALAPNALPCPGSAVSRRRRRSGVEQLGLRQRVFRPYASSTLQFFNDFNDAVRAEIRAGC